MGRHIKIIQPNFFSDTAKYIIHPTFFPGRQANFIKAPWDVHPKSGISFRASRLSFEQVRVLPSHQFFPVPISPLQYTTICPLSACLAAAVSLLQSEFKLCQKKELKLYVRLILHLISQTVSDSDGICEGFASRNSLLCWILSPPLSVRPNAVSEKCFFFIFELFHGVKKFQADGFYILTA